LILNNLIITNDASREKRIKIFMEKDITGVIEKSIQTEKDSEAKLIGMNILAYLKKITTKK
jgi:hypothetical protein